MHHLVHVLPVLVQYVKNTLYLKIHTPLNKERIYYNCFQPIIIIPHFSVTYTSIPKRRIFPANHFRHPHFIHLHYAGNTTGVVCPRTEVRRVGPYGILARYMTSVALRWKRGYGTVWNTTQSCTYGCIFSSEIQPKASKINAGKALKYNRPKNTTHASLIQYSSHTS